jgi:hypothetical protein
MSNLMLLMSPTQRRPVYVVTFVRSHAHQQGRRCERFLVKPRREQLERIHELMLNSLTANDKAAAALPALSGSSKIGDFQSLWELKEKGALTQVRSSEGSTAPGE